MLSALLTYENAEVAQLRKINGYLQWKLRRANKEDDEDLDAVSQAPSKPASRKARSKTGSQAGSTLGSPRARLDLAHDNDLL